MILITGASGKTGRATARALLATGNSPWKGPIRALVHRPEQIQPMLDAGAQEVIIGDLISADILEQATRGIRAIYHIPPNVNPDEVLIGRNLIAAARASGVEHIVYHSVLHPQTENMPHHWQKLRVEELLIASGLNYTILQPCAYMQNVLGYWDAILRESIFELPYAPSTRISMVDLEDIATVAAVVLTQPGHFQATYELAGPEALSQYDIAEMIGNQLGRKVINRVLDRKEWEARVRATSMPDYSVRALLSMFEYYEAFGFTGNPGILSWLLGRPAHRFTDFLERVTPRG